MAKGDRSWDEFQSLLSRGGYGGWDRNAAWEDFKATGAGNQYANVERAERGPSAADIQREIEDAAKKEVERETKWLEQNVLKNPFVFDEQFAKQAATAEYEPYYKRLLDDYLEDVKTKRETIQSDVRYLKDLKEYDTQNRTIEYEKAVQKANQGWLGKGLASSGMQYREVGQTTADYLAKQREREGYYGETQKQYDINLGELTTEEQRKRRDIFGGNVALGGYEGVPTTEEGEYQKALEAGIEQRRKEGLIGYYQPIEQAYYRAFPKQGNQLKGYMPAEYYSQLYS